MNGWLGGEKHVLETESNSFSECTSGNTSSTTISVVMSRYCKLKLAHGNMQQVRTRANVSKIVKHNLGIIVTFLEQCSKSIIGAALLEHAQVCTPP